jgi:hypothetical protein
MKLRDHPLMMYRGRPNWPPAWVQTNLDGGEVFRRLEVGILQLVMVHDRFPNKIFLVIKHQDNRYIGSLLFNDVAFCRQIGDLLDSYIGRSIEEIGDLDVTSSL